MSLLGRHILVSFALFLPYSHGLNCFKCYRSNYRDCDMGQKSVDCGNNEQCFSLIYVHTLKTPDKSVVEEHGFMKGCSHRNIDCESYCKRYNQHGYKDCKVSCCKGDDCNVQGFQDMSSKKKKRSSSQPNGSSSSYNNSHSSLIFILVLVYMNLLKT